ncbi:phage holin family protein [Aeromicrobium sp. YIM 150415]|uniref:phage holin family protein n=1 Tax=Aeromicrobium sp. YIM 150415 TaxID=2803912 RepID=UPI0019631373|nr:phage holin family protein [Aeromicrobium sp. YIM 150415]MBM9462455.1 phage holin family protein [Aeromicrobium sp. YIM 150415]
MARFISTWFASSLALAFAALLLGDHMNIGDPGETTANRVLALAIVGLVFTIVNMLLGPIVKLLSLPFIILTLGLLLVVINALLLMLTEWITGQFAIEFFVDGFWWAVLASIVISIAQTVVNAIIGE